MNAYTRCKLECLQITETFSLYEIEILLSVKVWFVLRLEVQFEVIPIELIEVIHRDVIIEFLPKTDSRLIRPASCHVLNCVATSPQH